MLRISTFKIQSKRVELPKGNLNLDSLIVSFNEMYRDYVVYYPGSIDKYITNIGDIELGFGPRYLLHKLLKEVRKANPDGTVDNGSVVVKTIPQLPEPLTRRLGSLEVATNNEVIEKTVGEPKSVHEDVSVEQSCDDNSGNIPRFINTDPEKGIEVGTK